MGRGRSSPKIPSDRPRSDTPQARARGRPGGSQARRPSPWRAGVPPDPARLSLPRTAGPPRPIPGRWNTPRRTRTPLRPAGEGRSARPASTGACRGIRVAGAGMPAQRRTAARLPSPWRAGVPPGPARLSLPRTAGEGRSARPASTGACRGIRVAGGERASASVQDAREAAPANLSRYGGGGRPRPAGGGAAWRAIGRAYVRAAFVSASRSRRQWPEKNAITTSRTIRRTMAASIHSARVATAWS